MGNIKVKHHQARAQLQCYIEDGYNIHRALELVISSYKLTDDDLSVIRNMDMAFVFNTKPVLTVCSDCGVKFYREDNVYLCSSCKINYAWT